MSTQPQVSVRPWDSMAPNFHDAPRFCNSSLSFHDSLTSKSSYIDPQPRFLRSVGAALKFDYGGVKPSRHMGHRNKLYGLTDHKTHDLMRKRKGKKNSLHSNITQLLSDRLEFVFHTSWKKYFGHSRCFLFCFVQGIHLVSPITGKQNRNPLVQ